ncbi:MAG: hypothetical protein JXK05_13560 [Campylobacterales bacterium]|nr:hypothetical protein [Campylobacterales bacterium]
MRPPRGFGANYFTLAAIQATVAQVHQSAVASNQKAHRRFGRSAYKEAECEAPPDEEGALLELPALQIKAPRRRHRPYASAAPPFGV